MTIKLEKKMIRTLTLCTAILTLAACAPQSFPVYGHADRKGESFTGKAYEPYVGSGGIEFQLVGGGTCQGHYKQTYVRADGSVHGEGNFECVGGLTGQFTYQGSTQNGVGTGTFSDGTKFTVTFGADP
jgi:hypothetical protein